MEAHLRHARIQGNTIGRAIYNVIRDDRSICLRIHVFQQLKSDQGIKITVGLHCVVSGLHFAKWSDLSRANDALLTKTLRTLLFRDWGVGRCGARQVR